MNKIFGEPLGLGYSLSAMYRIEYIFNVSYQAELGKSDHLVICFQFICYTQQPETTVNKLNYFKGNYLEINKELEAIDWTSILQMLT